jgi:hypothetical protein
MDATDGRFLVSRGSPDSNPYFEFSVAELAEGRVGAPV